MFHLVRDLTTLHQLQCLLGPKFSTLLLQHLVLAPFPPSQLTSSRTQCSRHKISFTYLASTLSTHHQAEAQDPSNYSWYLSSSLPSPTHSPSRHTHLHGDHSHQPRYLPPLLSLLYPYHGFDQERWSSGYGSEFRAPCRRMWRREFVLSGVD